MKKPLSLSNREGNNRGTDAVFGPCGRHLDWKGRVMAYLLQEDVEMEIFDLIDEDDARQNRIDNAVRALEDALNEPLDPME